MATRPKNETSILSRIGRVLTKLLYLEMGVYLVLGSAALLIAGLQWLVELFK